ncbi:MAG: orotate phosphoribosyltransferase [Methanocellales archaeon]|nr:orotate phosphoribosyltransferase [Methanocellales archaeon]
MRYKSEDMLMEERSELIKALKKAVKFGDFTLSSGKKSSYYIDKYVFETNPECLMAVGKQMSKLIPPGTQRLAGIELGSIPLAVVTSICSSLPYVMVRKEKKEYGTGKKVEGEFAAGEHVLLIEDVTTTGSGAVMAAKILRELGMIVDCAIVAVDREEGAKENLDKIGVLLIPLITARELLE